MSNVFWLIYNKQQVLLKQTDSGIAFPLDSEVSQLKEKFSCVNLLGTFADNTYYVAVLAEQENSLKDYSFQDLRRFYVVLSLEFFIFLAKGLQIANWLRTTQYCGVCCAPLQDKQDERARICPTCQQIYFPRISPAVIVAVLHEGKILLARSNTVLYKKHSLLAGFVEPGESLEQCVAREVKEEVGLQVKNIKYLYSQPWSFPDSLMMGFVAEHDSGEIQIDDKEIIEAAWFTKDSLPDTPDEKTIAGKIINWYVKYT